MGAMIKVNNLHKSFNGIEVLSGISEEINEGEVVVVIGPSGSGKSTFLRCLNLLETPDEGEVIIDGEQINKKGVDVNLVRQKMGMVFQQFNPRKYMFHRDRYPVSVPNQVPKEISTNAQMSRDLKRKASAP